MKSKKLDLWVLFYTLAVLILAGWLWSTATDAGRQERQIEELTKTNQELRADLEELRKDQSEIKRQAAADRADILGAVERVEDLEEEAAETDGQISNIIYTLKKWNRRKAQEEQQDERVAQTDTGSAGGPTISSGEATRASESIPETADAAPEGMTYLGDYILTAYAWTDNPCSSGRYPELGRTVASTSIPEGTWIYIEGVGTRIVEDTGPLPANVIDVYMGDQATCEQFGSWSTAVYIIN